MQNREKAKSTKSRGRGSDARAWGAAPRAARLYRNGPEAARQCSQCRCRRNRPRGETVPQLWRGLPREKARRGEHLPGSPAPTSCSSLFLCFALARPPASSTPAPAVPAPIRNRRRASAGLLIALPPQSIESPNYCGGVRRSAQRRSTTDQLARSADRHSRGAFFWMPSGKNTTRPTSNHTSRVQPDASVRTTGTPIDHVMLLTGRVPPRTARRTARAPSTWRRRARPRRPGVARYTRRAALPDRSSVEVKYPRSSSPCRIG